MDDDTRLARILGLGSRLWARKWKIAALTFAGATLGAVYSLLAPEIFVSRAIIYPKEISATSERSVLGATGLGGVLNPMAGISHLNRVEVVLKSPELALAVAAKEPILRYMMPEAWDAGNRRWKDKPPAARDAVDRLQKRLSTRVDAYKLTLEIKVRADDAGMAHAILKGYLESLNDRMKMSVIRDASANKEYLESQLAKTYDPWIREKIQQLILNQVESGMLLNANSFEVLEGPSYPYIRESPVRKRIVLLSAVGSFGLACLGVMLSLAVGNWRAGRRV